MPTSDSNNPGLVEVANQAYPAVLNSGVVDVVPRDFNPDASLGSGYAALPPPGAGASSFPFPTPLDVSVISQVLQQAPVSGVPFQFPRLVNINSQNLVDGRALAEFTVTEVGSFQTNAPELDADIKTFLLTNVYDADVRPFAGPISTTTRLLLRFTPASLNTFGIGLLGREIEFIDGPADGFTRSIESYGPASVIINVADTLDTIQFSSFPVAGNHFTLDVKRNGSEPVFDNKSTPLEINVFSNTPLENPTVVFAPTKPDQGNFFAGDGVIIPFVGSGLRVPPLLGTFEIAGQNLTIGLPSSLPFGTSVGPIPNVEIENQSLVHGLPINIIIS